MVGAKNPRLPLRALSNCECLIRKCAASLHNRRTNLIADWGHDHSLAQAPISAVQTAPTLGRRLESLR